MTMDLRQIRQTALKQMPDSAAGMAAFIHRLRRDLADNPGGWENVTLDDYLEALAAAFEGHRNHSLAGHTAGEIPYRLVAAMLRAATIYE